MDPGTCVRVALAAAVLGASTSTATSSDRLIEFSSRTLARLDQLKPATTPTTLLPIEVNTGALPRWFLRPSTGQLRPSANLELCLYAVNLSVTAAVALQPCEAAKMRDNVSAGVVMNEEAPRAEQPVRQQWRWDAKASQLSSAPNPELCVTATPIGILHTLSMARCDAGDNGTRWSFSAAAAAAAEGSALVVALRSAELALYPDSVHPGVRALLTRLRPLFVGGGPDADQVLMGCYGWMLDLSVGFTGEQSQQIPIINPESPQWSTGNATYGDLRLLIRELRTAARARGLPRLRLGVLFVGWAHLYNLHSAFAARHPEIYINGGQQLAHGLAWSMATDRYPYASRPRGVAAGSSFFELFGAQWAALSAFLSLDVVVLRDGMSGFAVGGRHGPFGDTASGNATENQRWIDGVRELFKQTKTAAPNTTVLGYSQQGSAVGVYRVGLSDVEQLVADGYMDAWVDQSWAGAWEDVPTRFGKSQGWTYQLLFILVRRAQIEGGNRRRPPGAAKCKHLVLHGTFDAYEGFDTLHKVPGKLEWGIRAYALAALVRPGGEHVFSDGHYISWANSYSYVTGSITSPLDDDSYLDRPTGLMTCTDVAWLSGVLDSTDRLVGSVGQIAGPTAVYDRATLASVMALRPDDNVNEWLDEQLGLIVKYGVPLAKIARIEDGIAPAEHPDGVVISVPAAPSTSPELVANLSALATTGAPVVLLGRCDLVAAPLLALAGVECMCRTPPSTGAGNTRPPYYGPATLLLDGTVVNATVSIGPRCRAAVLPPTDTRGRGGGGKALATLVGAGGDGDVTMAKKGSVTWAQLNDYTHPVSGRLQVSNYGTGTPHYLLATQNRWGLLQVMAGVDQTQPIALHAWSEHHAGNGTGDVGSTGSDGRLPRLMVLAGNLEGNNCGAGSPCSVPTQLTPRSVTVALDTSGGLVAAAARGVGQRWLLRALDSSMSPRILTAAARGGRGGQVTFVVDVPVASCRVYVLHAL